MEGKYGTYQGKGGTRGADDDNRAIRSRIVFYPNNVETSLIVNCDYRQLGTLLRSSYDSAWAANYCN
ncbi:MAG: hypothetical protein MI922_03485 [Bacteroidales bacterium]|nr:hypothetical protein [Bacteroidales bacterium]